MRYVYLLLLSFLFFQKAEAQETLAKDISYDYLDKLIDIAKKNYPRMKAYDARIEAGNLGIKKAKLSYFDIFSAGYLYSPNNNNNTAGASSFLGGYQLGFFANVGALLQKPSVIKQARAEVKVAEYDKQAFELNLEADVKKRYFTYVQTLALLRIKSDALLDIESLLKETRHKFEKGETTLQNYNNVLLMYSNQLQTLVSSEAEIYIAKGNLEELVGQKLENIK